MATRMRAPGLGRAGLFTLLGVLFAAVLVTVVRAAYGFSNPFEGADGWDVKFQDAVLVVGLIASPLFFLVGLGAFDYWFYWAVGQADASRGPLLARRDHRGRTTSASTPITR